MGPILSSEWEFTYNQDDPMEIQNIWNWFSYLRQNWQETIEIEL